MVSILLCHTKRTQKGAIFMTTSANAACFHRRQPLSSGHIKRALAILFGSLLGGVVLVGIMWLLLWVMNKNEI